MMTISAIVLAAGQSTRFGSDKLLAQCQLNGQQQALIHHSLDRWLSVFKQISLVVRPDHDELLKTLQVYHAISSITIVTAAEAEQGMAYSLMSGIKANTAASAWLIGLADMPLIPSSVLQRSIALLNQGKRRMTAPYYQQQQGHPVGFSAHYRDALLSLSGDKGAKSLLKNEPENICAFAVSDPNICIDIDTPADLSKLVQSTG